MKKRLAYNKRLDIRLTEMELAFLREIAKAQRRSMSGAIRQWIRETREIENGLEVRRLDGKKP